MCCRVCHFCQISQCVRSEAPTAQPNIQLPINEVSTQYYRLCLPSFTNLIVYVDLTRMTPSLGFSVWIYLQRRLTSNLCFQLRIRFPRKQVVPKMELKHNCLQIAAKDQLPEYTTNPVSNCPIVQCQSPKVHFPESSNHQLQTRSPQFSLVVNSCFSYSSRLRSDATTVAILFDCCANRITCCHFLVRKVPIVRLVLPALWFAPKISTEALFKLRVT